jgi:L-ribulose-5-phosphate 4-epimerase
LHLAELQNILVGRLVNDYSENAYGPVRERYCEGGKTTIPNMLQQLREQVLEANLELVRKHLVLYTFGNASGISREEGLVVIKPSGVPYDQMQPGDLVITDLDGKVIEGKLRPSSDLPTHLILYKKFPEIGGVAHTHSEYATAWAQARKPIPCFGTTHADYFHGPVPVSPELTDAEIVEDYEKNTGIAIVRCVQATHASAVPAILVANHAPFTWGKDVEEAAHNAVILEAVARMAYLTLTINAEADPVKRALHDKHYLRKHGKSAYYGQAKEH